MEVSIALFKSVIDYDQNSTKYRWSKEFTSAELDKYFSDLGGVNSIQIINKSNTDRVLKIRLMDLMEIKLSLVKF